jgi:predicted DNA-binding transcriptional regulator YafY
MSTTSRALAVLNLLQTHRHWPGRELAERLGVTERTVRRDVERLRDLGYRIESVAGVTGGYRLEAGAAIPPLLLDDDEAVAIAVGLRVAAQQRLVGGADTTLTALAKLEQVLPPVLRRRVAAVASAIRPTAGQGSPVAPSVLGELALACRDSERLRLEYTAIDGVQTTRRVDPHVLAPAARNWYLICWDLDRDDWRTFRVDRIGEVSHTRVTFEPHALTDAAAEEMVLVATGWARQNVEADLVMELPLETVREEFGVWAQGATAEDAEHTRWPIGGSDWREALYGALYVPEGVEYTTTLAEPERSATLESLRRMVAALEKPPPPLRTEQEGLSSSRAGSTSP